MMTKLAPAFLLILFINPVNADADLERSNLSKLIHDHISQSLRAGRDIKPLSGQYHDHQ
jgi:hypothetical protein